MKNIFLLSLVLFALGCSKKPNDNFTHLNLEKGDYRYIQYYYSDYTVLNNDTVEKYNQIEIYKFEVIKANRDFFIFSVIPDGGLYDDPNFNTITLEELKGYILFDHLPKTPLNT